MLLGAEPLSGVPTGACSASICDVSDTVSPLPNTLLATPSGAPVGRVAVDARYDLGPVIGKGGAQYIKRGAFCLETQHFANAPNIPAFPTTELKPGKIFYQVTEFRFSTAK